METIKPGKQWAVDDIYFALGWWGLYEKVQYFGLCLPLLTIAYHLMSIVFIGRENDHVCAEMNLTLIDLKSGVDSPYTWVLHNASLSSNITYHDCEIRVTLLSGETVWSEKCRNGYLYSKPRDVTIVSEWDLVCDKGTYSDLSQTVYAIGAVFGAFFFPALADRFGRKPIYMMVHCFLFVLAILLAFSPNFIVFTIIRFWTGIMNQGIDVIVWVLLLESLPANHRAMAPQIGMFLWPIALMIVGGIGYLTKEMRWRDMQLLSLALSSYIVVQWWLTDESLPWLVSNNKFKDAKKLILKAAKWNKVSAKVSLDILNQIMKTGRSSLPVCGKDVEVKTVDDIKTDYKDAEKRDHSTSSQGCVEDRVTFVQAMRNKHVVKLTAIKAYMWFTASLTYYGLIFSSPTLTDSLYLGYFASIAMEIPAAIVYLLIINRWSRKTNNIIFHAIAGLSLVISVLLDNIPVVANLPGAKIGSIVVALFGKSAITVGYGVLWIYTPECFPTNIRNTCFGLATLAGSVGTMIAPFARSLGRNLPWAPDLIFSILCLGITTLTRCLPETQGQKLPQTLADMEDLMHPKLQNKRSADSNCKEETLAIKSCRL